MIIMPPIINIVENTATQYISLMNEGPANVIPNIEDIIPAANNIFFADLFIFYIII